LSKRALNHFAFSPPWLPVSASNSGWENRVKRVKRRPRFSHRPLRKNATVYSPCATYPPCTGLALSGLQSERLKLTPLNGDTALDDEDANQRSSEIRLLPKPRRAYKDIMFEPEQPVLPKETSMNAKPEFSLVDTDGIRLRVAQVGKGPLIVLVHGWPESWYSWRHQIPPLAAAGYRVAAIDVRGYGGSDKPEPIEAYSIKEMCTDGSARSRRF